MKYLKYLLILLFIPFIVYAENCTPNDVIIKSIEVVNTTGNVMESNDASIEGKKINLDLKMYNPGDSIEYTIVLNNVSNEEYYFDEDTLKHNTEYINYEFIYNDDSNIIKPNSTKEVTIIITYNNKVPIEKLSNGILNDTNTVVFNLSNKETINEVIKKIIDNPNTSDKLIMVIILLFISYLLITSIRKKRINKYLIFLSLLIPITIYAICTCNIELEAKIEIDGKEAVFLTGKEVNIKMKELAGDDLESLSEKYTYQDTSITAIKKSNIEPNEENKEEKNIVSTPDSEYPIYMWYDENTIYWWSKDPTPLTNEDASSMFLLLTNLVDISGVKDYDTSNTNTFELAFAALYEMEDYSYLRNWDISNATNIGNMFISNRKITNIDFVKDWDVSNVEQMYAVFGSCDMLESIEGLKDWNVTKVRNLNQMFLATPLIGSLKPLSNWDTKSLFSMSGLFARNTTLTSLEGLENWDVSHVRDLNGVFSRVNNLVDIEAIRNWDTSSVENIFGLFFETAITSTEPIKNWNTQNVKEMWNMFVGATSLEEVDLNNWDVSNVTDMSGLFYNCSNIKELDLSNWVTPNVTDMSSMFSSMTNLEELDISNFDTRNVTTFKRIFNGSNNLKHIYVGTNWNTSSNTDETTYVFPTSSFLPNFSTSNTNYRDLSYAHTNDGGYLSVK